MIYVKKVRTLIAPSLTPIANININAEPAEIDNPNAVIEITPIAANISNVYIKFNCILFINRAPSAVPTAIEIKKRARKVGGKFNVVFVKTVNNIPNSPNIRPTQMSRAINSLMLLLFLI